MKKQVVYVSSNGIKVVVDKHSDPRNVQLFNSVLKK